MLFRSGVQADPAAVRLYDTVSAPDGTLLVFGLLPALSSAAEIPPTAPDDESLGWEVLPAPAELGFTIHTAVATRYFTESAPAV